MLLLLLLLLSSKNFATMATGRNDFSFLFKPKLHDPSYYLRTFNAPSSLGIGIDLPYARINRFTSNRLAKKCPPKIKFRFVKS